MFADYQRLIVEEYQRQIKNNVLPQRLLHPSPARLREACVEVCRDRFLKRDENTLKTFFELSGNKEDYLKVIADYDIDKFRPLVNFLKQKTGESDFKNIELLAWLLDFTPRPYELGRKYIADGVAVRGSVVDIEPEVEQHERLPAAADVVREEKPALANTSWQSVKPSNYRRMKLGALLLGVLAITGISIFWPKTHSQQSFAINGLQSCMYWAGDHYQQVSCNQRMGSDTMVIALDTFKLRHLKKITLQDTITNNSIGSVWYSKIDNQLEFFTADGFHPVHPENRLRPITQYIISKYLEPVSSSK